MSVVFIDTFSGGVGTMRGKSDPMKVLRVLKSDPNISCFDESESPALHKSLNALVRCGYILRWLSAESMAAMLDMSPRQFAERLACKPGFPKPAREGHPRWNVAEVHEWMRARRDERVVRRKAA